MKKLFVFFLLAAAVSKGQNPGHCQSAKHLAPNLSVLTAPENLRSDTADILKYTVALNVTDFTTNTISGNTIVRFSPKINGLDYLCLDLLELIVDSVTYNNSQLTWNYNDTLLRVNLPAAFNTTDTLDVCVYYHGAPVMDASGWGGWYFSSGYAFNLGVGFDADPHVYGRVWHPCFDNFSERAKYEFKITTNNGKIAYCNGALTKDTTELSGLRTRTWVMNDEIPTYLASISVAAYTHINKTFSGQLGQIPVMLTALPTDTTALKNSFIHLPDALAGFESFYGPYVWNRIGYCLVPFSSGAMEHATNITYPKAFANGSITYEASLMAHEFAHHWWGDHVTCETASEMWINEGMASYSEYLFRDWYYGWQTYIDAIKTNHEDMVHYAHLREGPLAVSGVPHEYTYGDHVYRKGADMAHTMRGYLGDSLFKVGLNYVQGQKGFKNMSTVEFGQLLSTATGVNMSQFMSDWILNPGWPHFSIDSVKSVSAGGGNYTVDVFVKQKLLIATNFYTNVPLEITFRNSLWQNDVRKIMMSGQTMSFSFTLPFDPIYTGINVDSKISDAVSSKYLKITTVGTKSFVPANLSINVSNVGTDSSWVRVEHNFTAPDSIKNNTNNYRLNNQHYWKISGIFTPGFQSKGTFSFDGRKVLSGAAAYLDTSLYAYSTIDSVILLYRKNAGDDWKEVEKYTKAFIGGSLSKRGTFVVDTLRAGEYTTANGVSTVLTSVTTIDEESLVAKVYPNPAKNNFTIELPEFDQAKKYRYELYDVSGRKVKEEGILSEVKLVSKGNILSGNYILKIYCANEQIVSRKIIFTQD
jgi:hypothetical protein